MLSLLFLCTLFLWGSDSYVLMVSFDGFRHDYAEWAETPNFDSVATNGVKADGLIPVFPSLTFPNHYSIATGAYAGTHNITGNSFYDKSLKEKYSLYDRDKVRDARFYKSEPIWVTAEKQGVRTASYFWVGTEAPIKGYSPSIFKYYDGDIPFKTRVDSVTTWFSLPEDRRPRLIMLYFSEPDHTGHVFGVDSLKIKTQVESMDSLLGYVLTEMKDLDISPNLNIIITSDHGMTNVSKDRLVILDNYLSRMDDVYINGRGTHVQFDLKKGAAPYKQALAEELSQIPNATNWKKDDIPRRFHFVNQNTGEYLLLADEGYFITTQKSLNEREFTLGGMHGYDPQLPSMWGIFYAMGTDLKTNFKVPAFENIHIYPLVCRLLEIEPYKDAPDAPQGKAEVLIPILEE
ncbi:MAG: ectonucleotide pyrophosphatase/phosphodiesterase [Candidatus Marinimicrobia bacterium]|nr:ectonucleotide pyrophosphatase/phosphodiesterase [Candidatus Neomarinimicrobiota bacterium]